MAVYMGIIIKENTFCEQMNICGVNRKASMQLKCIYWLQKQLSFTITCIESWEEFRVSTFFNLQKLQYGITI
jgi:hypothetical protein